MKVWNRVAKYVDAKHVGNIVRGASALGVIGNIASWYNSVNERMLYEVIDKIGNDVTGAANVPLGIYGAGEAYNLGYKLVKGKRKDESAMSYLGRVARDYPVDLGSEIFKTATISTPFVATATDNDFFASILVPAAVCIGGHFIGYINRALKRGQISDLEKELYDEGIQNQIN